MTDIEAYNKLYTCIGSDCKAAKLYKEDFDKLYIIPVYKDGKTYIRFATKQVLMKVHLVSEHEIDNLFMYTGMDFDFNNKYISVYEPYVTVENERIILGKYIEGINKYDFGKIIKDGKLTDSWNVFLEERPPLLNITCR